MVVWLLGFKKNKDEKKNDPKKEWMKAHCERLKSWFLLNDFTCEFFDPKKKNVIINLGPNNQPRSAQIFHH